MFLLLYFDYAVIGRRDFFLFLAHFVSFLSRASLLTFSFCFFVLFNSCCSNAKGFGKKIVH